MIVFHFAGTTLRDGTPLPGAGEELPARDAVMCESGWHGSDRAIDALRYAPGCKVAIRDLYGEIVSGEDKSCGSHCRMLTGYVDATAVLCEFAQWCAGRTESAAARAAEHAAAAKAWAAEQAAAWNADYAALAAATAWNAERAAQEEWLRPRVRALLGLEAEG